MEEREIPEQQQRITPEFIREACTRQGYRIGFTNGCFDLLHPGHIRTLETARGGGRLVVVGLNTDESVKALKGPDRPIQDYATRSRILLSLKAVDYVIPIDDESLQETIETLNPDVLVKGGDYESESITGADLVKSRGGMVLIVEHTGESSSEIVQRIRGDSNASDEMITPDVLG